MPELAPPKDVHVKLSVRADEHAVRASHKECDAILRKHNVAETIGDISQIVLGEVLNNIVEHAYAGNPNGEISIDMKITPDRVEFEVSDAGVPFPGGVVPDGAFPDIDVTTENLPEGGFGWPLIHSLVEDLKFVRLHGRNTFSFFFSR